jgi:4-alpha-glucanotransferase
VPGTLAEYPNWSRVLPVSLDEMRSRPELSVIARIMSEAGRSYLDG